MGSPYLFNPGPVPNIVKVLALVGSTKIWEGDRSIFVDPDLAEHSYVGIAHEHLPEGIEAVGFVSCQSP